MSVKLKFKPVITRVRLNPEQAVLLCPCWDINSQATAVTSLRRATDPQYSYCDVDRTGNKLYSSIATCLASGTTSAPIISSGSLSS